MWFRANLRVRGPASGNICLSTQRKLRSNQRLQPLRRAMKMVFKGTAQTEEVSDLEINSPSAVVKVPHVIRLVRYVHVPRSVIKFSRRNVLVRDQYTCQYCHKEFPTVQLTLDHVLPISRGGETTWENVVTACKKCNNKKRQ